MLRVDFTFDKKIIEKNGYTMSNIYETIKMEFDKKNISCVAEGEVLSFGAGEKKNDFSDMWTIIMRLTRSKWFLNYAKEFVLRFIMTDIENKQLFYDSKTILQELIQGRHEQLSYELIDESGPDHDKQFTVAVLVDGERVSEGEGHTKKAAEQQAAYQALLLYRNRE